MEPDDQDLHSRGRDNEALDVNGIVISEDDVDRIEEAPQGEEEKGRGAPHRGETYEERRRRKAREREEERRRRRPVATPEEIAALKAEPSRNTCALPVCCANIRVFCALVSAIFLLHGALSKYTLEVLPHLGRRYPINQLEQEFITGVEKIGFIITLLFVAFFGNRMNKVSAISSGAFLTAIGSVLMATPYFIYGLRSGSDPPSGISDYARAGLCQPFNTNLTSQCDFFSTDDNRDTPFSLFCVAQFIIGIGAALYATLALVYLEDNSTSKESPLMIGIALGSHALGSFLGTLLAHWFTTLPENASGEMTPAVAVEQVGAWWLGYPVLASVSLLLGTCTLWFPDWFVQPDWLKRRRFKKRLLRYRKKKRVIATKKRKEQIKKMKKAAKTRQSEKTGGGSPDRDKHRSVQPSRGESRKRENPERRRKHRPRAAGEGGRRGSRDSEPVLDGTTTPVPDVVSTHNGSVPSEGGDTHRNSHHSDDSRDSTTAARSKSTAVTTTTKNNDKPRDAAQEEKRRKEKERRRRKKRKQEQSAQRYRRINLRKEKLRDLPRSLYKLVKDPVLLSGVIGSALAAFLLTGYTTELPTYLRIQFRGSNFSESIAAGFAGPVALSLGTLIGAVVTFRWEPTLRRASLVTLVALGVSALLLPVMFAFSCDLQPVIPVEIEGLDQTVDCREECDCVSIQREVVHGADGKTFSSPCHAGCSTITTQGGNYVYQNCWCVGGAGTVFRGPGSTACDLFIPATLIVFLAVSICSVGIVPTVTIFLRYGREKKRSLVIGYAFWMIYLFGYVPSTPIFRSLRNNQCDLWKEDCREHEVCWTYDRQNYRYTVNGAALGFHAAAVLAFAFNYYKLRSHQGTPPDVENNKGEPPSSSTRKTTNPTEYDNPMMVDEENGERRQASREDIQMRPEDAGRERRSARQSDAAPAREDRPASRETGREGAGRQRRSDAPAGDRRSKKSAGRSHTASEEEEEGNTSF